MNTSATDRLWPRHLEVGDVVRAPSGRLRIVRRVSHYQTSPHDVRTCVYFTIAHPSWTGRPYTVMTGTDLVCGGYRPTGARAKLGKPFDAAMERAFDSGPSYPGTPTATQVMGIP